MRSKKLLLILCFIIAIGGIAQGASVELVPLNASFKYLIGTVEASTPIEAWRAVGFNDASWTTGPAPLGYGEGGLGTTVPTATMNVYMRHKFSVTNPNAYAQLSMTFRCDDGFVAWINGVEVARANVPGGDLFHTDVASSAIEPTDTTVTINTNILVAGDNVLAVHVFNANATSSDLYLSANVTAIVDDTGPTVVAYNPTPNAVVRQFNSIEVTFSEDVAGVDVTDFLINGSPATDLVFFEPFRVKFSFTQPPTGSVQVAWAQGHGITDTSASSNAFAGGGFSLILNPNAELPRIRINEFLASNGGNIRDNAIRDEDGDPSDWIEIYNPGPLAENLNGWFLTDLTNVAEWAFPNVTMPPDSYLLIWASGKNRRDPARPLHANFSLRAEGEYLALLDPQTNVVSAFGARYPSQSQNVSYGRDVGNPDLTGYFTTPTPRARNSTSGAGFGPEVQFSAKSTLFRDTFNLVLSTPDTNAEIRYITVTTSAGLTNLPAATSTLYTGPIAVNRTMQVRARTFVPGRTDLFPGPVQSESFVQVNDNVASFSSELPIVVLHTVGATGISDGSATSPDTKLVVATFDNTFGYSSLTNKPDAIYRAGFNARGSSTQGFPKQSYALEIQDEYGGDRDVEFLGLPEESDWVLYAPNFFDRIALHNPLAYEISRQTGQYASRTRYVEVFLNAAGTPLQANMSQTAANMLNYHGIYVLEEKIKRNKNRVDVEELTPEHTNAPAISGGYMLKQDRLDAGEEVAFTRSEGNLVWVYPENLEMSLPRRAAQVAWLQGYFNSFMSALTGTSATNPVTGYAAYIDVDEWIDHHIPNVITINADAFRLSGYMYKDRNGKLIMGPVWDFDRGLGTGDSSNNDWRAFNPIAWMGAYALSGTDFGTDFFNADSTYANPYYSRLFRFPDFWQAWIDRYQDLTSDVLSTNAILAMVDRFANEIRVAHNRDRARWGTQGNSSSAPRTGTLTVPATVRGPTGYTHVFDGTFQGEVDFQKRWFMDRLNFINTNLLNRPLLGTPGGQLTNTLNLSISDRSGKAGTIIYYTLDGTDPRLSGGAISPRATAYTGPIVVSNNVRVVARAYNPNHSNTTGTGNPPIVSRWSGVVSDSYYFVTPPLRITEIMYRPPSLVANDTNSMDNFEYIEFKNTSGTSINLAGYRLRGGVDLTFTNLTVAPGGYFVVVSSTYWFRQRYAGNSALIAGEFTGNLNNAGERLILEGPLGEPILDFEYSDNWAPITDGLGFSLVVNDENAPTTAWNESGQWQASAVYTGSPGSTNGAPPAFPQVVINEVLSHTDTNFISGLVDTVELYNPGSTLADISGWFLTDDLDRPTRYTMPAGTVIPAGGYLVLYETNTFGAGPTGFRLSSWGDEIYLLSGTGGQLTGYMHGFDFGAQHNGVSFGRHVISTGEDHLVTQTERTLGAANSGPAVGPIVISEIMYRPADIIYNNAAYDNSLDEYIELRNISTADVPLYDPQATTNTWRLQDAVAYSFPMGTTIPAGGYALVVNFNPTNAPRTAEFRQRFNLSPSVPLFGPYEGKLNNNSARIELMRPDRPEPIYSDEPGFVPYVLVERVAYEDGRLWPLAADGFGPAMHRKVVSDYANDPANWVATVPSPGGPYVGGTLPVITQQPGGLTVIGNNAATFTVTASGNGPITYQWLFNGSRLADETNATLELPRVKVAQAGEYAVIVLNPAGAVVSSNATLTVLAPVEIVQQPKGANLRPGGSLTLAVSAYTARPVTVLYQWYYNDSPISGANGAVLTFTNLAPEHDGLYKVVVSDDISSDVSDTVRVAVLVDPFIMEQPQNQIVAVGETLRIGVTVTNTATLPIEYRWRKNSRYITTNTTSLREDTYELQNVQTNDGGIFAVVPANLARNGILSRNAYASVVVPPTSQEATIGTDATFEITVVPTTAITYQWTKAGAPTVLSTNRTLVITNVQASDLGDYNVLVTLSTNTTVSRVFTASLSQDSDGDGMPDTWEDQYSCLNRSAADANADADNDGMNNLAEYQAGTNPCDGQSYLRVEKPIVGQAGVTLRFQAIGGKSYSVLYQETLSVTNTWSPLLGVDAATTNRTVEVVDPSPTASARFYRLVTPKQ